MDTDVIKRLVRVGRVSSVNASSMRARVVFTDMENTVSAELPVLCQGSLKRKQYWLPDIDEQVVCLMLPNASGKGSNDGFILGTFFSDADKPVKTGANIRRYDFGDGSYVEHDASTGNLTINAVGDVIINGANIKLNS